MNVFSLFRRKKKVPPSTDKIKEIRPSMKFYKNYVTAFGYSSADSFVGVHQTMDEPMKFGGTYYLWGKTWFCVHAEVDNGIYKADLRPLDHWLTLKKKRELGELAE